MKKIATTASLLAFGAASLHAIYAPELNRIETGKPWTVAASLRGFYDDNRNTAPDWSPAKISSWGFEARPYVAFNLPMEQTFFGISYLNSSRYYSQYSAGSSSAWDFDHEWDVKLNHQFTERYRAKIDDNLIYGVTPEIAGTINTMPFYRSDLSMLRNRGLVNFTGEVTEHMGFSLTYLNTFYDYLDDPNVPDSYAARLNRIEQTIPVDLRWQVQPDLVALVGYQYGRFDYTGDGTIGDPTLMSDSRNSQYHAFYVGGDYDMTAQFRASVRVGAQYSIYDDFSAYNQWTPYADISLSYYYTVGSRAELGFKHVTAATDVTTPLNGVPTLDQEVSAVYLSISHQFTPKLSANLLVQYQWSSFYGGVYNDNNDDLLLLSLYFNYKINQFLSAEAGYTYDWLDSNVDDPNSGLPLRSYTRNYVYLGFRAQY
jgi:hypothetical protein